MLFFPEFLIPEKSNVDIFIHKKETAQNPFWVGLMCPTVLKFLKFYYFAIQGI